jgi:DNA-binding Xre family transcriptional regulator
MAEKQLRKNKVISTTDVVNANGLARATVLSWIKGDLRRFDEDAIIALCNYSDCEVGELLVLEDSEARL